MPLDRIAECVRAAIRCSPFVSQHLLGFSGVLAYLPSLQGMQMGALAEQDKNRRSVMCGRTSNEQGQNNTLPIIKLFVETTFCFFHTAMFSAPRVPGFYCTTGWTGNAGPCLKRGGRGMRLCVRLCPPDTFLNRRGSFWLSAGLRKKARGMVSQPSHGAGF